jgi:hypothetical protein
MEMEQVGVVQVPVYWIWVLDIHTDLSIEMKYVLMETNQTNESRYVIANIQGVEAEIYLKQDGTADKIGWQTLSIGAYYYGKNAVKPGTSIASSAYTIRWRPQSGRYAPYLNINIVNSLGTRATYVYYTGSESAWLGENRQYVQIGTDGYYTVDLDELQLEVNEIAYLTFSSFEISGSMRITDLHGTYEFDIYSIYSFGLLSSYSSLGLFRLFPDYPKSDNQHIFKGYRIEQDMSGRLYQPGELIDLSKLRLKSQGVEETSWNFIAQWEEIDPDDTVMADLTIKLRLSNGNYENEPRR